MKTGECASEDGQAGVLRVHSVPWCESHQPASSAVQMRTHYIAGQACGRYINCTAGAYGGEGRLAGEEPAASERMGGSPSGRGGLSLAEEVCVPCAAIVIEGGGAVLTVRQWRPRHACPMYARNNRQSANLLDSSRGTRHDRGLVLTTYPDPSPNLRDRTKATSVGSLAAKVVENRLADGHKTLLQYAEHVPYCRPFSGVWGELRNVKATYARGLACFASTRLGLPLSALMSENEEGILITTSPTATNFYHLIPALPLSMDDRASRRRYFRVLESGEISMLLPCFSMC